MSATESEELTEADIQFLAQILHINEYTEKHEGTRTASGQVPATITAIWKGNEKLSKGQVNHRMREGAQYRPFGEGGRGYITVHPPLEIGGRTGPKSAELTPEGRRVLAEALDGQEYTSEWLAEVADALNDDPAVDRTIDVTKKEPAEERAADLIDSLGSMAAYEASDHPRVADDPDTLVDVLIALERTVAAFDENEYGAFNDDLAETFEGLLITVNMLQRLISVFEIDRELLREENFDNDSKEYIRDQVRAALDTETAE